MERIMSDDQTYSTERSRKWLAAKPGDDFASTINNIEKYGCQVMQVRGDSVAPGWSYSIGVYDTCGQSEIIAVGLPQRTALIAINEAANLLRSGVDLTVSRHREIVGEIECEFRPVDPKWVDHIMGRAMWYYEDDPPPTLQLIYPDLENRFQWEPDFDQRFLQPLLQPGIVRSTKEEDFWAVNDQASSLFAWPFPDPPHTGVYLSKTVHEGTEPITYVSNDIEDNTWQFLGDSMADGGGPVLSCFHHPIDNDPSLKELADLPLGWWAERAAPGEPWIRCQHEPTNEAPEA